MNPILRNVLAVFTGWIIGSMINMYIVGLSAGQLGLNPNDVDYMNQLKDALPTAPVSFFIYPFLAHALGTLVGAFTASLIAGKQKMRMALIIGLLFLLGGIMVNSMLPGPLWFTITDILFAYIPMAWIGGYLGTRLFKKSASA